MACSKQSGASSSTELFARAVAIRPGSVAIVDSAMGMARKADAIMRKQQIKAAADEIMRMLRGAGLVYDETVDIDNIGVHPENRFGSGPTALNVHKLISAIIEMGWSWLECGGARAFEAQTDPEKRATQETFNCTNIERADGQLAGVRMADLRILTVTCSHTVAGVRAVKHGAKSDVLKEELLSPDGNISKEKVFEYSRLEQSKNGYHS